MVNGKPRENRRWSRREFVATTALVGGALLIGVAPADSRAGRRSAQPQLQPNAFLRLDSNDRVTAIISKSEMGQGVTTALALIVAEELGARWDQVEFERAPLDQELYGAQATGGSSTVRLMWEPLRRAGAAARALLESAAAAHWDVDPSECAAADGQVRHASGRHLRFGELVHIAAELPVPEAPPLRSPQQFRLIGQRHRPLEVQQIVCGQARFGLDVRVPGMRFAAIARPAREGATLRSFDATKAKERRGVVGVVEVPASAAPTQIRGGVAVVATDTWSALQARREVDIEWNEQNAATDDSRTMSAALLERVARPARIVTERGDASAALERLGVSVDATYEFPFLSQAPMEPMNCTARVDGDRCTLWSPCQFPDWAASATAEALDIPVENVTVHTVRMGGGFGRRINPDFSIEAALVARAIGAPVQVVWSREDDFAHGFYRPMMVHRLQAALDDSGYPLAILHRAAGAPQAETPGISYNPYRCPNFRSEAADLATSLRRGWWRSVVHSHSVFAIESFVDELAHAAAIDPVDYRLALIDGSAPMPLREMEAQGAEHEFDPERLTAVLELVRDKSGWDLPLSPGRYRGVACHWCMATYVAEVAEISLTENGYAIERITAAVDCGIVIDPVGAEAQVAGGIADALSAARTQEITVAAGRVQQKNYDTYRLTRMPDAPRRTDVHFMPSSRPPSGLGEPPVPPAAAALANALHRATGRRFRRQPFDRDYA